MARSHHFFTPFLGLLLIATRLPADETSISKARKAVERGLDFLQKDAVKWRKERQCSTCHHGTFTVWALAEARNRGYKIDAEHFTETVKWTKERLLEKVDLPRDTRPGWKMVSTPGLLLSAMAQGVPEQDAITADELKRIAGHLLRHQEEDGSWSWASAPAKNRPPPVFESDEVATLLGYLAIGGQAKNASPQKARLEESRNKAAAWLAKQKPNDTTQAAGLRLLRRARDNEPAKSLQPAIDEFFARQNKDGGWPQVPDAPSDAYATGQALYLLNLLGTRNDRPEIARAVDFLVRTQKEDGSWPMKTRSHPGATPSNFPVPITYFGSAWATMGLMRSIPK